MNRETKVFSVSEITRHIKRTLEGSFPLVSIQGELFNVKLHAASGHVYFALKDESASIAAVMWRSRAVTLDFIPADGMKVIISGRLTVYEPRGNYQVEVHSLKPAGVGELQAAIEQLRRQLEQEGLFNEEHKKALPEYPERIGVVTSSSGAVLHDILNILGRRFPGITVIVAPVKVQGPGAAREIASALRALNALDAVDVIVLARGGGSPEDLWAFNDESVARAIFDSAIPVVSAVGHETDYTIADYVSDLRAPTPSAAAELIVPDQSAVIDILRNKWYTMHDMIGSTLSHRRQSIHRLLSSYALNKPLDLLRQFNQRIDELDRAVMISTDHRLAIASANLKALEGKLATLDPESALRRGYSIVYRKGKAIPSSAMLHVQDEIDVRFRDGSVHSIVTRKSDDTA